MKPQKWKRIYQTWYDMKKRCLISENLDYKNYGGRGIKISNRWLDETLVYLYTGNNHPISQGFLNFYNDMEATWFLSSTIGRINNDGDYCQENCRWITKSENSKEVSNRRVTNGTNPLLGKGITVLDITTGLYLRITKEEYWKGRCVKYACPNTKVAKEFRNSKNSYK